MSISVEPAIGNPVTYAGKHYIITHVLDMQTVLGREETSGELKRLNVHTLKPDLPPVSEEGKGVGYDLVATPDAEWNIGAERYKAIRPLLAIKDRRRTRADVAQRAKKVGVSTNTLYRWLKRYEGGGRVTDLIPNKPGKSGKRLDPALEAIIEEAINERYLTPQRRSVQDTIDDVLLKCRNATPKLTPPGDSTIRRRIAAIEEKKRLSKRHGKRAAEQKYDPKTGSFPDGNFPLQTVQIDHTKVDLELVDDVYRIAIGRPWITLAIDVYSRMCLGFYISFDSPNAFAVGSCLTRAILPKERWLAQYGVEASWPCWGLPEAVHADTAKEFRGKMLRRACKEYDIESDFRPKGKAEFGGHIERLMDTFAADIHKLPGTTFHNVQEKRDYDSAGSAVMTLSEFETWLAQLLVKYHNRVHSEIFTSPLVRYEEAILGNDEQPGRGLPAFVLDEERLRLDLMPFYDRTTVQNYGVRYYYVDYYSDVLRRWIHAPNPKHKNEKRKFIIRYDPRDMSRIYFLDPELDRYYEIPYANVIRPPASLWEMRKVVRHLKKQGAEKINEDDLFAAMARMREIEEEAARKTRSARRNVQRRTEHAKATKPSKPAGKPPPERRDDAQEQAFPFDLSSITPFDELQES